MHIAITSLLLHMPSWHVQGGYHLYKIWHSHTNVDEDSLCLGCNDTRGLPSNCKPRQQEAILSMLKTVMIVLLHTFSYFINCANNNLTKDLQQVGHTWICEELCNVAVFTKVSLVISYVKMDSVCSVLQSFRLRIPTPPLHGSSVKGINPVYFVLSIIWKWNILQNSASSHSHQ
jgi:hypothetical protein